MQVRIVSTNRIVCASGQSFPEAVGSDADDNSAAEHLRYALWTASHTFQGTSTKVAKRVMLFTNNGDPLAGAPHTAGYYPGHSIGYASMVTHDISMSSDSPSFAKELLRT